MVNKLKQVNTFNKGINKDVAPEIYDDKHYTDARWLSPITNEENNLGNLVNPKSTLEKFRLASDEKLVGHTVLRDIEILVSVDTGGNTHIYKYQDDNTSNYQSSTPGLHLPEEEFVPQ